MRLFDVYGRFDKDLKKAKGSKVYTEDGTEYMDFYGGHGVISIGHSHPTYAQSLKDQIDKIVFYSNYVENELQEKLAQKLGNISNCNNYELFLCNSGAEANENALKLASFHTNRSKVLAIDNAFHGRTSAAVNVTDIDKIKAPINKRFNVTFIKMNDAETLQNELATGGYAAVIVEPIQGVGGLDMTKTGFLDTIQEACNQTGTIFIADEIQCGYGRSGKFFAHQFSNVKPHIITCAKGMGNGFPIAGVLIDPEVIKSQRGMLGTTFGGNHLACAAGIAVLDVINEEGLMENALKLGRYLQGRLEEIPIVREVKGRGLMMGAAFDFEVGKLRSHLINKYRIFTGGSNNKNLLRILPPLNISQTDIDTFVERLKGALEDLKND